MTHWIFISSVKRFRMNDWLAKNDVVEYYQRNKVSVNDIVFLYTTAPISSIEYKMVVEKTDIPFDETIDDSEYSLSKSPRRLDKDAKFVRLRLLSKTSNPNLHLDSLRNYGLRSSMQTHIKVSGDLLDYIEEQFGQEQRWRNLYFGVTHY